MGGLLSYIGAGIAEAADTVKAVSMEQIKADIESERQQRLAELNGKITRDNIDYGLKAKEDADSRQRDRVKAYAESGVGFKDPAAGLIASNAGLNNAYTIGADENVGTDVQNRTREATPRDIERRALMAGDLPVANSVSAIVDRDQKVETEADRRKSDAERWKADLQYRDKAFGETVRHNKQIEANSAEKISPAAKAQLEMAQAGLSSAMKEEALAATALNNASKGMDPQAITDAKANYESAKRVVVGAMSSYDKIGAAHFGEKWKTVESVTPASSAGGPAIGTVREGFEFTGGNPNDKSNWRSASTATAASQPGKAPTSKRAQYEQAMKHLQDLKGGILPTPRGKDEAIAQQQALVDKLYEELY